MTRASRSLAGSATVKWLVALLSGVALAAACGQAASNPSSSQSTSNGPVSISIGLPASNIILPPKLLQEFEQKYPNISVTTVATKWGDWPAKLQAMITANQTPTVFLYDGGTVQGYGAKGLALDLKGLLSSSKLQENQYINLRYSQDPKGHVWGIPQAYQPVALAYNKSLFDQAGVSYPTDQWTWSDMVNAATKLTQKNRQCGLITDHDITAGWLPFMWANGGEPFNSAITKADFTAPRVQQGVAQWQQMVQQGVVCNQSLIQANRSDLTQVFGKGLGAMFLIQYGQVGSILQSFPSLNWDVAALPRGAINRIPNIANPWVIYSHASQQQQQAAWTFLQWWLSPQVENEYATYGYAVPDLVAAAASMPASPAHLKAAFVDAIAKYGHTMYETSKWGDWEAVAEPIFLQIFEGQMSTKDGLQQVNTAVNGVLSGSAG